jgi:uncharacterized membrane protein YvbJ
MAIIKCPECNKEVSDTAKVCPHCGYKVRKSVIEQAKREIRLNQVAEEREARRQKKIEHANPEYQKKSKKRIIGWSITAIVAVVVVLIIGFTLNPIEVITEDTPQKYVALSEDDYFLYNGDQLVQTIKEAELSRYIKRRKFFTKY